MKVVEYRKHLINGKVVDPEWIISGGHYFDSATKTFVGTVEEEEDRMYHVPDTLLTLTFEGCVQRAMLIHTHTPFMRAELLEPTPLTEEEILTQIKNLLY